MSQIVSRVLTAGASSTRRQQSDTSRGARRSEQNRLAALQWALPAEAPNGCVKVGVRLTRAAAAAAVAAAAARGRLALPLGGPAPRAAAPGAGSGHNARARALNVHSVEVALQSSRSQQLSRSLCLPSINNQQSNSILRNGTLENRHSVCKVILSNRPSAKIFHCVEPGARCAQLGPERLAAWIARPAGLPSREEKPTGPAVARALLSSDH